MPCGNIKAEIGTMRKAIIIIALLLCGCAHTWQPKCRHEAMLAALVVGEHYPVRIVSGTTKTGRHAQAEAKIGDRWVCLGLDRGWIWTTRQDNFTPDKTYRVEDYFNKIYQERGGPQCGKRHH